MPKLVVHHEAPTVTAVKQLPFYMLFGASATAASVGEVRAWGAGVVRRLGLTGSWRAYRGLGTADPLGLELLL